MTFLLLDLNIWNSIQVLLSVVSSHRAHWSFWIWFGAAIDAMRGMVDVILPNLGNLNRSGYPFAELPVLVPVGRTREDSGTAAALALISVAS